MSADNRIRTADALARWRRQQRDQSVLALAKAQQAQQQQQQLVTRREQTAKALDAAHAARLHAGRDIDPGLLALSADVLVSANTQLLDANTTLADAKAHTAEQRDAVLQRQREHRLAENWREDLLAEHRTALTTADFLASFEGQNAQANMAANNAVGTKGNAGINAKPAGKP